MQVNPDIQYNEDDAGLSLDEVSTKSGAVQSINDAQDEADLSEAEARQKDVVVNGTQVISSPRGIKYSRIDDKLIMAGSMAAGVFSVIAVYVLLVFL